MRIDGANQARAITRAKPARTTDMQQPRLHPFRPTPLRCTVGALADDLKTLAAGDAVGNLSGVRRAAAGISTLLNW